MSELDDAALSLILRFSGELDKFACADRRISRFAVEAFRYVLEDQGFVLAKASARKVYRSFLRRSPHRVPLSLTWHKAGIDAFGATSGVEYVEELLSKSSGSFICDSERRVICAELVAREAVATFVGEKWSIRLERRGTLRRRNASDSRFPNLMRQDDDDELCLEIRLLPVSRCYPNCNCRYDGELHIALLFPDRLTGNTDLLKKSVTMTGCYTCARLFDPRWHVVHQAQRQDGSTTSSWGPSAADTFPSSSITSPYKLIVGVQCSTGWTIPM